MHGIFQVDFRFIKTLRIPRVDGILEIMIIVQRGETLWNIKENRCQSGWMILFVVEFKVAKKVKDLEKMADEVCGRSQRSSTLQSSMNYGIAFCGKDCLVKYQA